jgi:hypothetical protein
MSGKKSPQDPVTRRFLVRQLLDLPVTWVGIVTWVGAGSARQNSMTESTFTTLRPVRELVSLLPDTDLSRLLAEIFALVADERNAETLELPHPKRGSPHGPRPAHLAPRDLPGSPPRSLGGGEPGRAGSHPGSPPGGAHSVRYRHAWPRYAPPVPKAAGYWRGARLAWTCQSRDSP